MRVVLYIRVSTDEQAQEGYSIKAQIDRLNSYAVSQDWKVVETYIDDGESAKDLKRTELSRLLSDLSKDKFDIVLVYKLDRLTRSVLDLYTLLQKFDKYNVKFKSATEVYDTTTAIGRLFITLVAALAQWERENLAERVKMGMMQKAKEGKWTVSIPPFGYDKAGKDDLVINEKEAEIVKEAFDLYVTGKYGTAKIAKILNSRKHFTKSGSAWSMQTLSYVLKNPIYIGTMRYNYRVNKEQYFEVENSFPAIITNEIFDEAQRLLNKRSTLHPRKATSPHIFAGVARCARCGSRLSGKQWTYRNKPGQYYYGYYCPGSAKGMCNLTGVSQNYLEIQFIKYLEGWKYENIINEELLSDKVSIEDIEKKISELNKELVEVKNRRAKWQYAWANDLLSDSELKERLIEEQTESDRIEKQISDLENNKHIDNKFDEIKNSLKNITYNWNELDAAEKRKVIEIVVEDIYVDKTDILRKPDAVKITDISFL